MANVKLYTTQEVADKFQISKKTLYRWEESGRIPRAKRAKNRYRMYSEQDIKLIEKLSKEGRMNWTKDIVSWVAAKEVTPELWKMIKLQFPAKYRKIQEDINSYGASKIRIGFADNLKPVAASISL